MDDLGGKGITGDLALFAGHTRTGDLLDERRFMGYPLRAPVVEHYKRIDSDGVQSRRDVRDLRHFNWRAQTGAPGTLTSGTNTS